MKIFDILGPIMIGPSSSHTAGACRIGKIARTIAGIGFYKVTFCLHGSFAETYKGHGTDKALLAGVLGCDPDDEKIRTAYSFAKESSLEFEFEKVDLGQVHPNTVKIIFHYMGGYSFYVTGSSIGGGNVVIIDINGSQVSFTGDYPTFILKYPEQKGVIAFISSILSENGYNIESMRTIKLINDVSLIIEIDTNVDEETRNKILKSDKFIFSKYIVSK